MATAAKPEPLLTVEEFAARPVTGWPEELVRGKVVRMNPPRPYHGYVCSKVDRLLGNFVEAHDLGFTLSNDSGVVTGRNPDTLRGADIAFFSRARIPKGPLPRDRYLDAVPDLVVEVRPPDDRWPKVVEKVSDYLNAGVTAVAVLDPDRQELHLYAADAPVRVLTAADELTLPDILPAFRVVVGQFFE